MRIGIISGYYPGVRFTSPVNHKAYADTHGYHYIYNATPECGGGGYFFKVATILRYMDLFDWIFWIDDDAYFTDFSVKLEGFIANGGTAEFLICASPSTKTIFTKFSSGQFLLKTTARSRDFLRAVLATDMEVVRAFWRSDLGYYTHGDQEAMVYLTERDGRFNSGFLQIVDHYKFNNRDFEYERHPAEHFLVHFTGTQKQQSQRAFCERLGLNQWIIPPAVAASLGLEQGVSPTP